MYELVRHTVCLALINDQSSTASPSFDQATAWSSAQLPVLPLSLGGERRAAAQQIQVIAQIPYAAKCQQESPCKNPQSAGR